MMGSRFIEGSREDIYRDMQEESQRSPNVTWEHRLSMRGTVAWSPGDNEQKRFSSSLKAKEHASCHNCNQKASAVTLRYPMAMGINKGHKVIKDTTGTKDASPSTASSWRTWSGRCDASVPMNSKQHAREVLKHQRTNAHSSTKKRVGTQQEEAGGVEQPSGAQDVPPSMNVYAPQVKNKNKKTKNKNKGCFTKYK